MRSLRFTLAHLTCCVLLTGMGALCACQQSCDFWDDLETATSTAAHAPQCHCTVLLSLTDGIFSNLTRTDGADPSEADATAGTLTTQGAVIDFSGEAIDESEVTTLWLFVVAVNTDAQGNEGEDWTQVTSVAIRADRLQKVNDELRLRANTTFTLGSGKKHLYIGANLSSELVGAFCSGTNTYTAPADEGYEQVMAHFVDGERGVAMFCDAPITFEIPNNIPAGSLGSEENPFKGEASLSRMVSKVLLTCQTAAPAGGETADETYAKTSGRSASMLTAADERSAHGGWCRMESIHYKLQSVNRSTYFVQQHDAAGNVVDPNYAVSLQLGWSGTTVSYLAPYADRYVYLSGSEQHRFTAASAAEGTAANYLTAEAYDVARVPGGDNPADNVYTTGLYCLENTCDNAWSELCPLTDTHVAFWRQAPERIVTGLIVEAQYIPAVIYTAKSVAEGTGPELFDSEAAAKAKLVSESETAADGLATYYSIDGKYCYTYSAMQVELAQQAETPTDPVLAVASNYQEFRDGICYFHDFMNSITQRKFMGVERNRYYLLICSALNVPTSVETDMALVSTTAVWKNWVNAGASQTITITPDAN